MICIAHGDGKHELTETLVLCDVAGERRLLPATDIERPNAMAVFTADKRDECFLIADVSQSARVNNVPVRGGLQSLRDGDCVEIEGSVLTVHITHEARQGVWEQAENVLRCPVCRATLRAGDAVTWCGHCDTPHHRRCFEARQGRCGVYGCPAAHTPQVNEGGK